MNTEEENKNKRKSIPLTNNELLSFFLLPIRFFGYPRFDNNDFNKSEIERFKKHGFDLKLKQAKEVRIYGIVFYCSLIIIIIYFMI